MEKVKKPRTENAVEVDDPIKILELKDNKYVKIIYSNVSVLWLSGGRHLCWSMSIWHVKQSAHKEIGGTGLVLNQINRYQKNSESMTTITQTLIILKNYISIKDIWLLMQIIGRTRIFAIAPIIMRMWLRNENNWIMVTGSLLRGMEGIWLKMNFAIASTFLQGQFSSPMKTNK